jgi:hypothetical protein
MGRPKGSMGRPKGLMGSTKREEWLIVGDVGLVGFMAMPR